MLFKRFLHQNINNFTYFFFLLSLSLYVCVCVYVCGWTDSLINLFSIYIKKNLSLSIIFLVIIMIFIFLIKKNDWKSIGKVIFDCWLIFHWKNVSKTIFFLFFLVDYLIYFILIKTYRFLDKDHYMMENEFLTMAW